MAFQLALGFPVGFLFGIVLSRGRFCMYTAFRELVVSRDTTLFRAYLVALALSSVLIHIGQAFGLLQIWRVPFYWQAALAGGLIFGAGMSLAGGCSSGTWHRVGEGMIGSFVALLGFGLATAATVWGILRPLRLAIRGKEIEIGGQVASLPALLHVPEWLLVGVGAAAVAVWAIKSPRRPSITGWSWLKTGLILGVLAAVAWYASSLTGRHYGLSITGPTALMVNALTAREAAQMNWGVFAVLGIPFGAFAASAWSGEFAWRAPAPPRLAQQFIGGVMMGFGAVTAGGCNIGHGLSGMAGLALSSFAATVFTILGAWAGTYLFFMRRARAS